MLRPFHPYSPILVFYKSITRISKTGRYVSRPKNQYSFFRKSQCVIEIFESLSVCKTFDTRVYVMHCIWYSSVCPVLNFLIYPSIRVLFLQVFVSCRFKTPLSFHRCPCSLLHGESHYFFQLYGFSFTCSRFWLRDGWCLNRRSSRSSLLNGFN